MNKEVIYLGPEDDITDILTKLQQAEQKLVALVPPKKATMLRSAVNMKLVARVAKECEKIVVIVTVDPAIVKMAMAARIPVAKTLQSRPVIPTEANIKAAEERIQVIDEETGEITEEKLNDDDKTSKNPSKSHSKGAESDSKPHFGKSADTLDLTEEGLEKDSEDREKAKKSPKKPKNPNPKAEDARSAKIRKIIMIAVPVVLIAIVALVWAFVFAPAATIAVTISSTAENFSENIKFTTDPNSVNLADGVLLAEKQSIEQKYTSDLNATGHEDRGERAKGELSVVFTYKVRNYQNTGIDVNVPAGAEFSTVDGYKYRATQDSDSLTWDGDTFPIPCNTPVSSLSGTCVKTFKVPVEAVEAGEDYNISTSANWSNYNGAVVSNIGSISGGTTDIVKVVSQSDVDEIKDKQLAEHTDEGRKMLLEDLSKDLIVIEPSFKAETGDVVATPAVGDVVGDNTKPNVVVTAIYSIYTIDMKQIEDFIKTKITPSDGQKIYSIGSPYIERFTAIEEPARLKTIVEIGPTVTEDDIFEKARGRKIGEVKAELKSITGVSSVDIQTPYFWVWSIPDDRSKVTIDVDVEDKQ